MTTSSQSAVPTIILRGGTVYDGSGAEPVVADVAFAGDTLLGIGDFTAGPGTEVIDVEGLAVAPGFIDAHTHFDAQVMWDPDLTPTCWHGVTSVVMGNCGFGIAPMRPEHREEIARTLESVEGMAAEVLGAGIDWRFSTFPEYLAVVAAQQPRLNVGAFIGHTPLRMYVMGADASRRAATDAELAEMRALLVEAMEAGAFGFSTTTAATHSDSRGVPVPSRWADDEEFSTLVGALGDLGYGMIQGSPGPKFGVREMAALSIASGRPVTWTALFTGMKGTLLSSTPDGGEVDHILALTKQLGGQVWPQIGSLPQVMQITLADPFPFAMLATFKEVIARPRAERSAIYADPAWRARARAELPPKWEARWGKTTIDESERFADLLHGPTVAQLAAERGVEPFDLFLDMSLAEDMGTRFHVILGNDDDDELAGLLHDPQCLLAVSDAGAHVSQLCDARYSTHFLRYWVRERKELSLSEAIWRLSGHVASVFGIDDRGYLRNGFAADVVVFDPETVSDLPPVRVWDLPAEGDRLVARAEGIRRVYVNGQLIHVDGADTEARPGRLLRPAH